MLDMPPSDAVSSNSPRASSPASSSAADSAALRVRTSWRRAAYLKIFCVLSSNSSCSTKACFSRQQRAARTWETGKCTKERVRRGSKPLRLPQAQLSSPRGLAGRRARQAAVPRAIPALGRVTSQPCPRPRRAPTPREPLPRDTSFPRGSRPTPQQDLSFACENSRDALLPVKRVPSELVLTLSRTARCAPMSAKVTCCGYGHLPVVAGSVFFESRLEIPGCKEREGRVLAQLPLRKPLPVLAQRAPAFGLLRFREQRKQLPQLALRLDDRI